jgi:hypothetical protein
MFRTIAFTTALVVLSSLTASPAAAAGVAELLVEEHFSQVGYEVDLYVTKADDGILAEATVTDPTTGDLIDLWSDGVTLWWNGMIDGEPSEGSMSISTSLVQGRLPSRSASRRSRPSSALARF